MERCHSWLQAADHLHTEDHHHPAGEQRSSTVHAPELGLTQVKSGTVICEIMYNNTDTSVACLILVLVF